MKSMIRAIAQYLTWILPWSPRSCRHEGRRAGDLTWEK